MCTLKSILNEPSFWVKKYGDKSDFENLKRERKAFVFEIGINKIIAGTLSTNKHNAHLRLLRETAWCKYIRENMFARALEL